MRPKSGEVVITCLEAVAYGSTLDGSPYVASLYPEQGVVLPICPEAHCTVKVLAGVYKVGRGPDWADVGVARRLVVQYRAFLAILLVLEADRDRVGLYEGGQGRAVVQQVAAPPQSDVLTSQRDCPPPFSRRVRCVLPHPQEEEESQYHHVADQLHSY